MNLPPTPEGNVKASLTKVRICKHGHLFINKGIICPQGNMTLNSFISSEASKIRVSPWTYGRQEKTVGEKTKRRDL